MNQIASDVVALARSLDVELMEAADAYKRLQEILPKLGRAAFDAGKSHEEVYRLLEPSHIANRLRVLGVPLPGHGEAPALEDLAIKMMKGL